MKYVLVSGGVISGIGKGIIASSTGLLLKTLGLKVSSIKVDPYMNVDAGTMAPTEHGEVFVLDDGGEVDLDLGNYERYLNIRLKKESNITTGKIYQHVIERERRGDYLGKTVQVVPHLTDATQDWIERVARVPVDDTKDEPDVCIIELGGTVGDIESAPFIEAMQQLRRRVGKNNFLNIHVSLIPVISGEQKTKPTQAAIKNARSLGLNPDLIACRCSTPLDKNTTDKIAMFCQVEPEQVVAVLDVPSTYHVPALLERQGLIPLLRDILKLDAITIPEKLSLKGARMWEAWNSLTNNREHLFQTVTIVLVGKYTNLHDSYLSVIKSLEHAAMACGHTLDLRWVDASNLEPEASKSTPSEYYKAWHEVSTAHGILVPGGFGKRGTEGMIKAAEYARMNNIPYLGICLGMQLAVIEYARNVCGIANAASIELDEKTTEPIVIFMPEIDKHNLGGTMRLGLRPTHFQDGSGWSRLRGLYSASQRNRSLGDATKLTNGASSALSPGADVGAPIILERHRHRYEVNPEYIERLASSGLHFVGKDDKGERMEIIELKDHRWFVGVQFHPEYLSRVLEPSKPYLGFVAASAGVLDDVMARLKGSKVLGIVNGSNGSDVLVNGVDGLVI